MQRRSTTIIWVIAIFMAATAIYRLFRSWRWYWSFFAVSSQESYFLDHLSFWWLILIIIFELMLALKLVASYGLFRIRSWARILAIVVLLFDYASGLAGAIQMCWYTVFPIEPPPIKEGMSVVGFVSLWPTYIIAFMGIISVFFLTRSWIAAQFKKISNPAL